MYICDKNSFVYMNMIFSFFLMEYISFDKY